MNISKLTLICILCLVGTKNVNANTFEDLSSKYKSSYGITYNYTNHLNKDQKNIQYSNFMPKTQYVSLTLSKIYRNSVLFHDLGFTFSYGSQKGSQNTSGIESTKQYILLFEYMGGIIIKFEEIPKLENIFLIGLSMGVAAVSQDFNSPTTNSDLKKGGLIIGPGFGYRVGYWIGTGVNLNLAFKYFVYPSQLSTSLRHDLRLSAGIDFSI